MKIAFVFFPNFTLLDVVGVYDPLWRLKSLGIIPDLSIDYHAYHQNCQDSYGFSAPKLHWQQSLIGYDVLFVPGGIGTRPLRHNEGFLNWLQTGKSIPLITSVCTGSLLLAAAGMLEGHSATTHFNEYDGLGEFLSSKQIIKNQTLVDDGNVITAGAVAASITLGLHLCKRLANEVAMLKVKQSMGL